jgi:hypothetical protein
MGTRSARPLEWLQALPPPAKDLPFRRWAVLVRLALAMGRDGSGCVTIERLAREAGVSTATAKRATSWAQGAGLLEQTARGHRITDDRRAASTYQLRLPNSSANEPLGDATPDGFPSPGFRPPGDPTAQNGPPNGSPNEPLVAPFLSPLKTPTLRVGAAPRVPRRRLNGASTASGQTSSAPSLRS